MKMNRLKNKFLSVLLSAAMVIGMLSPMGVQATEAIETSEVSAEEISIDSMTLSASGTYQTTPNNEGNPGVVDASVLKDVLFDGSSDSKFWNSNWVSKIEQGNPYLQIDLDGIYEISEIKVAPRWDNGARWDCTGNIRNLFVEVRTDDAAAWSLATENAHVISTSMASTALDTVDCGGALAKSIRLSATESHHWQSAKKNTSITIAELVILGTKMNVAKTDADGETAYYATLQEAISAAEAGETITILTAGTYTLPAFSKDLTIKAADGVVAEIDMSSAVTLSGVNAVFENLTFNYAENSHYKGLHHVSTETYVNCTIKGQMFTYGETANFTGCTFSTSSADYYNLWTYGTKNVNLDGCTFECAGKSVLVYNEGACATNLSVEGCEFNASQEVAGKAAIEIDTSLMPAGTTIAIDAATTAAGFAAGSVSGNSLWNDKKNQENLTITVADETVWPIVVEYAASVNGENYVSLAEAVAAATADDTITFLADIEENVTVNKNLTIDGADMAYTGTMTVNNVNVTIQNVNFAAGQVYKAKNTGLTANITIKDCDFDGQGLNAYALNLGGTSSITIEDCTAENYGYGLLQVPSATTQLTVKDVEVNNVYYAFKVDYATAVSMENVSVENSNIGILDSNYGVKTYTITNCDLNAGIPIGLWDRNTGLDVNFVFVGENEAATLANYEHAILKLAANATLKAPESLTITTDVVDHEVVYAEGVYSLLEIDKSVAKIGEEGYDTLAEAIAAATAGDTITFVANIEENVTVNKAVTIDGAGMNYTGTMTLNNVNVTIQNVNFVKGNIYKNKKTGLTAAFVIKNCDFDGQGLNDYAVNIGGSKSITIEDCTAENYGYGLLQVPSATTQLTVKDVEVSNVYYAFKVDYATAVSMENVTITDTNIGIYDSNYGAKTYTIKNCKLNATNPIKVWERNQTTKDTFKFEGVNEVPVLPTSQFAIIKGFAVADKVCGTLAEAIAVAETMTGDVTIKLYDSSAEDVVVSQKAGLNLTIDGNRNTFSGTIEIHGNARYTGEETLTIKNMKFETSEAGHYFIDSNKTGSVERYAHNVTVENCYFVAADAAVNSAAAMRIRQGFNINLVKCEAENLHSMLQAYGCAGIQAIGLTINGCKNGIAAGTSTNVVVEDSRMLVTGYGVRADGTSEGSLEVLGCTIEADLPVVVRKATGTYAVAVEGGTLTSTNAEMPYGVVFTNGDDGTYELPNGTISANVNADVQVWPISEYVANINGKNYISLADAIAAVQNGETITLVNDCAEDVTIKQVANKSFTIDGAGYTYTGTISINGNRRSTGAETLTIKNVNFVAEKQWQSSIFAEKNTYVHNVTVDGCTFTGNDAKEAYGIRLYTAYNITVKNTEATKLYDLVYGNSAVTGFTAENVTITDCGMGFWLPNAMKVTFNNVTMSDVLTGIGIGNDNAGAATITDCNISAETPVYLTERTGKTNAYTLTFSGNNTLTSTVENGTWLKVVGTAPIFKVVLNDTGLDATTADELAASIGNVYYNTLKNAVKNAKDGDVITIVKDLTFTDTDLDLLDGKYNTFVKVEGKDVTIDLNGKKLYADYTAEDTMLVGFFSTANNGHLTLVDESNTAVVEVKATATVYSLISNYNPDCSITINGGNYVLDAAKDCLIHDHPGKVVVNGGTFTLGNVGTEPNANGRPWIFNVNGQNAAHVTVSGGTFNADVANQYYKAEVQIVKGKTLQNNGDGTWTVVNAVAWNVQKGVGYVDVKTALKDAKAGQTVEILVDIATDFVIVPVDVTLDLNGLKLTADYLASYGDVVDNSADNTGLLAVSARKIYLHKDNDQLPVRDEEGYRFFEVVKFNTKLSGGKYYFQPIIEGAARELLKQGAAVSGVTISTQLSWKDDDAMRYQDFVYSDAFVNTFVSSYTPSKDEYSKMFTLTINHADAYENLTFAPVVVSDTGVEFTVR